LPALSTSVRLTALPGLPEVRDGADVGALLLAAVQANGLRLLDGDVLVVSSKVVSKAAGLRAPAQHRAATVLAQSRRVVAERVTPEGLTRIVESRAGPVMAAAGVDASNTGDADSVLTLPPDPDEAARQLLRDSRARVVAAGQPPPRLAVVISDTAGRPWRAGQVDFALGAAGFLVLEDLRGRLDDDGRPLSVTARAVADEVAAAADLVKGKTGRVAAAHVRGLGHLVLADEAPGAAAAEQGAAALPSAPTRAGDLIRVGAPDWFAFGHVEAVRASLGVPPGTQAAADAGIPSAGPEELSVRLRRAWAVATSPGGLTAPGPGHPRAHLATALSLDGASFDLIQTGLRVRAADPFLLGLVCARLLAALRAEGVEATIGDLRRASRPGAEDSALIVLL
jgi:coenzyme F420-0:L-glutamate ligase/coenzyme F420-1:gamma-L-glutamate ligase